MAWREIAGERAHQQLARMMRVVMNARHHIGAAEALRVFERSVGDQLAGLEVEQPQHDRGRAQVHGDAMERAVDGDRSPSPSIRMRSPSRVTAGSSSTVRWLSGSSKAWRSMRMCPASHRVAADLAVVRQERACGRRGGSGPSDAPRARCAADSSSIPSTTSTMHSLHLPCFWHDVGTATPSRSAKIEERWPGFWPGSIGR